MKQINISVPNDFHKAFKQLVVSSETTVKDATFEGIKLWIAKQQVR